MNVSGYYTTYVKAADFAEGETRLVTIKKVAAVDVSFDDDSIFTLNATNWRVLTKAFGVETDNWIGQTIKLTRGEAPDEGEMKPTIFVEAVSPPLSESDRKLPPKPPAMLDPDDPDFHF